jgi:hypothetical protein
MRYATSLLLSLTVACAGGETSVRQRFLAQSTVSVQFDAFVRSLNNQDLDSLSLVFHHDPELRVLGIDGSISRGWEEELETRREFFRSAEMVNFVPDRPEITVLTKDVVLTTFRHTLDIERTDGERDPTVHGVGTIVWTHDEADDTWKIRAMQLAARPRSGELEF